jgi:hypothetical protein
MLLLRAFAATGSRRIFDDDARRRRRQRQKQQADQRPAPPRGLDPRHTPGCGQQDGAELLAGAARERGSNHALAVMPWVAPTPMAVAMRTRDAEEGTHESEKKRKNK